MDTRERFFVGGREYEIRMFEQGGAEVSYEVWCRVVERATWPVDGKTQIPFTKNQLLRHVQGLFLDKR